MGNSTSSGLGSGANHGFRDVRTTDPETEVERPRASPESNRKSQEPNRKSHKQLPVPPKSYKVLARMMHDMPKVTSRDPMTSY